MAFRLSYQSLLPQLAAAKAGIHTDLAELVGMRHEAHGFELKSNQPWRSLLHGRYGSRIRGRGTDFAELRTYLAGDDVRAIDWRVTARTGEPHVRLYHEERERPVLLVLDQRIGMFFGSRRAMKSVTGAQTAALAGWRLHADGDRVGALLFNDHDIETIRPAGCEAHFLQILGRIAANDARLHAAAPQEPNPGQLNAALRRAAGLAFHGYLVIIVSDFDGHDAETRQLVLGLRQRNDVVIALIHDRLALAVPDDRRVRVGTPAHRVEWDLSRRSVREAIESFARGRQVDLRAWERELAVPVLPIATDAAVAIQLRRALGGYPEPGPRR